MTEDEKWAAAPLSQLMDYIVSTHHAYLNRQLPLIGQLLTAHCRQYWLRHPEFLAAHTQYFELWSAMLQHLLREETTALPLVRSYEADRTTSLAPFIGNLDDHEKEHAAALSAVAQIHSTLWDLTPPHDVGAEVSFTLHMLADLQHDLRQHIHLENDILFERVRALA